MKKKVKIIAVSVSLIFAISLSILLLLSPGPQLALHNPLTEEDYVFLEENALEVAKTLDTNVLDDQIVLADYHFSESNLDVTVRSAKAQVTASIPILHYVQNMENGEFISNGTLDFNNVQYSRNSLILPPFFYISMVIFSSVALGFFIFLTFFEFLIKK